MLALRDRALADARRPADAAEMIVAAVKAASTKLFRLHAPFVINMQVPSEMCWSTSDGWPDLADLVGAAEHRSRREFLQTGAVDAEAA